MNVFLPYQQPILCAQVLWNDKRRFNKQIIECQQILDAINGKKAWSNHPCTKMYKEHREWLNEYMLCLIYYMDFKNGIVSVTIPESFSERADVFRHSFLTDAFCDQHKRRLYTKAPDLYPQFEKFGTSEINFYFVDNKLLKYKNGKLVNE